MLNRTRIRRGSLRSITNKHVDGWPGLATSANTRIFGKHSRGNRPRVNHRLFDGRSDHGVLIIDSSLSSSEDSSVHSWRARTVLRLYRASKQRNPRSLRRYARRKARFVETRIRIAAQFSWNYRARAILSLRISAQSRARKIDVEKLQAIARLTHYEFIRILFPKWKIINVDHFILWIYSRNLFQWIKCIPLPAHDFERFDPSRIYRVSR